MTTLHMLRVFYLALFLLVVFCFVWLGRERG